MLVIFFILEVLASSKSEMHVLRPWTHHIAGIKITSHVPACPREIVAEGWKRSVHAVAGAQIIGEPGASHKRGYC